MSSQYYLVTVPKPCVCEIIILLSFLSVSNLQKEKKKHTEVARKKSLLEIMNEKMQMIVTKRLREESDDDEFVSYKLHEELQNKYMLQKKWLKENENIIAEKEVTMKKLTDKNKEMSEELKMIRNLNLRLQEELLKTPGFSFKILLDEISICHLAFVMSIFQNSVLIVVF